LLTGDRSSFFRQLDAHMSFSHSSRLYNEKAYVLSRGFIRRALEIPLGGLESEIRWLYYEHRRLEKILCDAKMLIEKSKATPDATGADQELAVPRLTAGGILTLERILGKLQLLFNSGHSSSPTTVASTHILS
jgi:ubiquitin-conjugating enzyme E2 O